jgi:hypothetical protein
MDGNGDTEEENVIRLPRDWVGPPEELVPIGSRARAREGRPAEDSARDDVIPDAGDFWGESAAAVHHVMSAPTETLTAGRPRLRRERIQRPRGQLPRVQLPWVRRRRTAAIAAIVGATAIVAIIGVSEGHGPPPVASATAAAQAHAQESATASHGDTARQRHRGSRPAARSATRAVPVRAFSERPSAQHVTVRRRHARRGAPHPRHAASRPPSVITTAVTTPVPTTMLPAATTTTSAVAPPSATTARDGTRRSDPGTSTHQSAAPSSGPLGPGDASGCDPKCS